MSERQTKAGNQECYEKLEKLVSNFLALSNSHSFTLSLSDSLFYDMLNNFCFHVHAQKSLSHSQTLSLTLSHSLTLTLSHSLILSFTLSRHAEQLLFSCLGLIVTVYSRKLQCGFF